MASSPRQRSKSQLRRRSRNRSTSRPGQIPWGWMFLTGLLYATTGMILAAFPAPYWIWNLAIGGAIAQALALAGPQALRQFRWEKANALSLVAILGAGAIAVALGIALGFVGTDNLDEVEFVATILATLRMGFLAVVVAALGAVLGATTGDRLLLTFNRLQTTLILAATCILGLSLGGGIGLLIRQ